MFRRYNSQEELDLAQAPEPHFRNDDVADIADWLAEDRLTPTEEHILEAIDALVMTHIRSEDFFDLCESVKDMHQTNVA